MSSGSALSEDTSAIPADESWCPEPAGAPLSPHVQSFAKRESVKLQLFQLSSLLCYAQISSQMMNYQCLFFFATFGSEAYKNLIVYSAFGWIFTLAVWRACGTGFSFSGEAWLVYQEREEAVDNLMIQMLDDVVLSMVFFPNRPFSLNCQWIFRNL